MAELCERQLLEHADGNGKPQTVHDNIKGINEIIIKKEQQQSVEEQQPVEEQHLALQHPPQQQPQSVGLQKISKSKKRNERRKNLKKKYWEAAKSETVKPHNFKRNNHSFRKNYSKNIFLNCKGGRIITGDNIVINMNFN